MIYAETTERLPLIRLRPLLVGVVLWILACPRLLPDVSAAPYELTPIVLTGQEAPGGLGQFRSFGTFEFKDLGEVAFVAQVSTAERRSISGIFLFSRSKLQSIALEGQEAPGAGGRRFGDLSLATFDFNNAGQIAFTADLAEGAGGGLFLFSAGTVAPLALSGQALEGTDILMPYEGVRSVRISDKGDLLLMMNGRIYLYHEQRWVIVPTPSPPSAGTIYYPVSVNIHGAALIARYSYCTADAADCAGRSNYVSALYVFSGGELSSLPLGDTLATMGGPAPSESITPSKLSNNGCLVFSVTPSQRQGDIPVAFQVCPKSSSSIGRRNAGIETPGEIAFLTQPASLNDLGRAISLNESAVAVFSGLFLHSKTESGGPHWMSGIFVSRDGKMERILVGGIPLYPQIDTPDQAPGTGGAKFLNFSQVSVNNSGDVVFAATLYSGGVDGGIFIARPR